MQDGLLLAEPDDDTTSVVLHGEPGSDAGIVLTPNAAERLATRHVHTVTVNHFAPAIYGVMVHVDVSEGDGIHSGDRLATKTLTRDGEPDRERPIRAGNGVAGVVTGVTQRGKKRDDQATVIEITEVRKTRVGDLLQLPNGERGVVASITPLPSGVDVRWGAHEGRLRVAKVNTAVDAFEARAFGRYSLVSLQPRWGALLRIPHLRALENHGAWAIVHERLTVLSDEPEGRRAVLEWLRAGGGSAIEAGVPETTRMLLAELAALGFTVEEVDEGLRVSLVPDDEIRARSSGAIRKPETINYRTFVPEPGGLFCQEVFGDVHERSPVRRRRFGHYELPVPVLHPWLVSAVADRLGVSDDVVRRVLYDSQTLDGGFPADLDSTGAAALRTALDDPATDDWFFHVVPVLPPDLRPLVPLPGGRFATSDLNDLYRRVINRGNRLRRLLDLKAPITIMVNEVKDLQTAVGALFDNQASKAPFTHEGRALRSLADGVRSLLERAQGGKRGDYSGRAVAVPDATLRRGEVRLPEPMIRELWKPDPSGPDASARVLVMREQPERTTVPILSLEVRSHDHLGIGVHPRDGETLDVAFEGEGLLVLRPLSMAAREEARRCFTATGEPASYPAFRRLGETWLAQLVDGQPVAAVLARAALAGAVDPVDHPRTRRVLGRRVG